MPVLNAPTPLFRPCRSSEYINGEQKKMRTRFKSSELPTSTFLREGRYWIRRACYTATHCTAAKPLRIMQMLAGWRWLLFVTFLTGSIWVTDATPAAIRLRDGPTDIKQDRMMFLPNHRQRPKLKTKWKTVHHTIIALLYDDKNPMQQNYGPKYPGPHPMRSPGPYPMSYPGPHPMRYPGPHPMSYPGPHPMRYPGPHAMRDPRPTPVYRPPPDYHYPKPQRRPMMNNKPPITSDSPAVQNPPTSALHMLPHKPAFSSHTETLPMHQIAGNYHQPHLQPFDAHPTNFRESPHMKYHYKPQPKPYYRGKPHPMKPEPHYEGNPYPLRPEPHYEQAPDLIELEQHHPPDQEPHYHEQAPLEHMEPGRFPKVHPEESRNYHFRKPFEESNEKHHEFDLVPVKSPFDHYMDEIPLNDAGPFPSASKPPFPAENHQWKFLGYDKVKQPIRNYQHMGPKHSHKQSQKMRYFAKPIPEYKPRLRQPGEHHVGPHLSMHPQASDHPHSMDYHEMPIDHSRSNEDDDIDSLLLPDKPQQKPFEDHEPPRNSNHHQKEPNKNVELQGLLRPTHPQEEFPKDHHRPIHTEEHHRPIHPEEHHKPIHPEEHHKPIHPEEHHKPIHPEENHRPIHSEDHIPIHFEEHKPRHPEEHHTPIHSEEHGRPLHHKPPHRPHHIDNHHEPTHHLEHYTPSHRPHHIEEDHKLPLHIEHHTSPHQPHHIEHHKPPHRPHHIEENHKPPHRPHHIDDHHEPPLHRPHHVEENHKPPHRPHHIDDHHEPPLQRPHHVEENHKPPHRPHHIDDHHEPPHHLEHHVPSHQPHHIEENHELPLRPHHMDNHHRPHENALTHQVHKSPFIHHEHREPVAEASLQHEQPFLMLDQMNSPSVSLLPMHEESNHHQQQEVHLPMGPLHDVSFPTPSLSVDGSHEQHQHFLIHEPIFPQLHDLHHIPSPHKPPATNQLSSDYKPEMPHHLPHFHMHPHPSLNEHEKPFPNNQMPMQFPPQHHYQHQEPQIKPENIHNKPNEMPSEIQMEMSKPNDEPPEHVKLPHSELMPDIQVEPLDPPHESNFRIHVLQQHEESESSFLTPMPFYQPINNLFSTLSPPPSVDLLHQTQSQIQTESSNNKHENQPETHFHESPNIQFQFEDTIDHPPSEIHVENMGESQRPSFLEHIQQLSMSSFPEHHQRPMQIFPEEIHPLPRPPTLEHQKPIHSEHLLFPQRNHEHHQVPSFSPQKENQSPGEHDQNNPSFPKHQPDHQHMPLVSEGHQMATFSEHHQQIPQFHQHQQLSQHLENQQFPQHHQQFAQQQFPEHSEHQQINEQSEHHQFSKHPENQQFPQHSDSQQFPQHSDSQQFPQQPNSQQFPQHSDSQQFPQHSENQQFQQRPQFVHPQFPEHSEHQQFQQQPQQRPQFVHQQFPEHSEHQQIHEQFPQHSEDHQFPQHSQNQQFPQHSEHQQIHEQFPQHSEDHQFPQHSQNQQFPQHSEHQQFPEHHLQRPQFNQQFIEHLEHQQIPEHLEHQQIPEHLEHQQIPEHLEHQQIPEHLEHQQIPEHLEHQQIPEHLEHLHPEHLNSEHPQIPEHSEHTQIPEHSEHPQTPEHSDHQLIPEHSHHQLIPEHTHHPLIPEHSEHSFFEQQQIQPFPGHHQPTPPFIDDSHFQFSQPIHFSSTPMPHHFGMHSSTDNPSHFLHHPPSPIELPVVLVAEPIFNEDQAEPPPTHSHDQQDDLDDPTHDTHVHVELHQHLHQSTPQKTPKAQYPSDSEDAEFDDPKPPRQSHKGQHQTFVLHPPPPPPPPSLSASTQVQLANPSHLHLEADKYPIHPKKDRRQRTGRRHNHKTEENSPNLNFLSRPIHPPVSPAIKTTSAYEILAKHGLMNDKHQPKISVNDRGSGGYVVPGTAGIDYPVNAPEELDFRCKNKLPGFYADVDTKCKVWHYCKDANKQETFLCPNGTIFNQKHLFCDWWYNVECEKSPYYFHLNANLHEQLSQIKQEKKRNNNVLQNNHRFDRSGTVGQIIGATARKSIPPAKQTHLHEFRAEDSYKI